MARFRLFGGNGDLGPAGKIIIALIMLGFVALLVAIVSFIIWKLSGNSTTKDVAFYSILGSLGVILFGVVAGSAMGIDFMTSGGGYTGFF
jgi:hypothetical protein